MAGKHGLLGRKLGHSLSPEIHYLMGDPNYTLYEIEPENVEKFIKQKEFDSINVTIPYKKTVMPYLSKTSEIARRIGSVNTIVKDDKGKLHGYNTDYYGFSYLLDFAEVDVKGKFCLVLGDGGAAASVKAVLTDRGVGKMICLTRSGPHKIGNAAEYSDADIIINTTPVGMYPDNGISPVSLEGFADLKAVIDLIYNPLKTKLILDAESRGIPAYNGLPMLTAQAKRSREFFLGCDIDDNVITMLNARLTGHILNITLIGMPGCGKSTIGKALADKLGRKLIDTDEAIKAIYGKTPAEIIEKDGEAEFRRMEHVAAEWAGKRTGKIIATGGGIVKRADNRAPLAQNGLIVFINRKLDELPTDGRPLSKASGVEALYNERLPIYRAWCDFEVDNDGSIDETVNKILKGLEH